MNICGCLLHGRPDKMPQTRAALVAIDGVEIHGETDDGRFVVVVEDTPDRFAGETIMAMHHVPGVLSPTLTYHHFEDLSEDGPPPPVFPTSQQPETRAMTMSERGGRGNSDQLLGWIA